MKKLFLVVLMIFLLGILSDSVEARIVKVKGYYKPSSGTYIQSHYKTSPNKSKFDNWNTKGNINPMTGKKGTVNPFK